MRDFALSPYFHPTTICFLDDNESFLSSLDLELPGDWACRMFTNPNVALEFLETPVEVAPLMDRCFSMQSRSGSEAIIRLDLNLIEQEINHGDRFRRNSVVVVDYAMPLMNGLDFCGALTDPLIRKAMLTGVADEKIAVAAFNAGLIHRFVPKHGENPIEVIHDFVDDLQREYFAQYSARLKNMLAIDPPAFLTDTEIANYVADLMQRRNLVEYYLVSEPSGLMLLESSGRIHRLVVLANPELENQYQRAARHNAPPDILAALRDKKAVACFSGDAPEDYFGEEAYPWQENVRPATVVAGPTQTYYLGLWEDAPADIDFDPATASYDAYLATL